MNLRIRHAGNATTARDSKEQFVFEGTVAPTVSVQYAGYFSRYSEYRALILAIFIFNNLRS